eukprot:31435-Pelagococcus_subviridis.AAC.7
MGTSVRGGGRNQNDEIIIKRTLMHADVVSGEEVRDVVRRQRRLVGPLPRVERLDQTRVVGVVRVRVGREVVLPREHDGRLYVGQDVVQRLRHVHHGDGVVVGRRDGADERDPRGVVDDREVEFDRTGRVRAVDDALAVARAGAQELSRRAAAAAAARAETAGGSSSDRARESREDASASRRGESFFVVFFFFFVFVFFVFFFSRRRRHGVDLVVVVVATPRALQDGVSVRQNVAAEGRGSARRDVGVALKGASVEVERRRGRELKPARDPGRRDACAGRESPQGTAFTTPTRSCGDRRD